MAVYFIREGVDGAIKIGWTSGNPWARLSALQTGNSVRLRLVAVMPGRSDEENELHRRFARLRLHGEWFRSEPVLLAFIDGVIAAGHGLPPRHETTDDLFGLSPQQVEALGGAHDARRFAVAADNLIPALYAGVPDDGTILAHDEIADLGQRMLDSTYDDESAYGRGVMYMTSRDQLEHDIGALRTARWAHLRYRTSEAGCAERRDH